MNGRDESLIIGGKLFYKGLEIKLPKKITYERGGRSIIAFDKNTFAIIAKGIIDDQHYKYINELLNKSQGWFQIHVWQETKSLKYKEYRDWAINLIHKHKYSWVTESGTLRINNYIAGEIMPDKSEAKNIIHRKLKKMNQYETEKLLKDRDSLINHYADQILRYERMIDLLLKQLST